MSFLYALLQRFGHVALFIICELIAFILIINFNQKQKDIFIHSSSLFSGSLLKKSAQIGDYLSLEKSNQDLLKENARLYTEIISMPRQEISVPDSNEFSYQVIPAHVINNNISSQRNYFTIDKGSAHGIMPSMGVVTMEGIAGIVKSTSKNYATVLSLLNLDIRVSASLNNENFFGTIIWDGVSFKQLRLIGIPTHAPVKLGDKIVTNGFSTIFPRGLEIGKVMNFDVSKNGALYDIIVESSLDFSGVGHVYVLKGNFAEEITSLEEDE